jgi:quercetin dioxygenase-like cupin family protein
MTYRRWSAAAARGARRPPRRARREPVRAIGYTGGTPEEDPMDETTAATTTGVAQVFDLHALKAFAPDKRVRKMLFKTDQLWSEIACYEPGQSTAMHQHPREEEAIFVLEGVAHMSIDGQEVVVPSGAIVQFPNAVLHDVRNPGPHRCVIMFLKVNPKVLKGPERAAGG